MKAKTDMNVDGRRWVSVKIAADLVLGVHVQTAYRLFYQGKLPGARIGRSVRIDLKKLTEQMEAQEQTADRGRK
jgi:excisionase family DNA binding protein